MQDSFGCSLANLFFDTPLVSEGKSLFAGVSWSFLRSFELLFGVSIYDLDAMCFANGIMFCEHWIATKIVRVGRDMEHYPLTYLYMQIATSMHKNADLSKIKL